MAIPTYTLSQFIGEISLSSEIYAEEDLNSYIEQYTPKLIADYLSPSVLFEIENENKYKWDKLFDGYTYPYVDKDGNSTYGYFQGFSLFIKYMLYFHIMRGDFLMSSSGAVNNKNENTDKVKHYGIAQDRYNKAVNLLNDCYSYIDNVSTTKYVIDTASSFPSGEYVFEFTSATRPLFEDGDIIVANDIEYTIYNYLDITPTYQFTIQATTGLTFTDFTVNPYRKVKKNILKKSYL